MASDLSGWSAFGSRPPPKRYPYTGAAFLGGFLLLSSSVLSSHGGPRKLLELLPEGSVSIAADEPPIHLPDGVPRVVLQRFRLAAKEADRLNCAGQLASLMEIKACQSLCGQAADALDDIVVELHRDEKSQGIREVEKLTDMIDDLAGEAHAYAENAFQGTGKHKVSDRARQLVAHGRHLSNLLIESLPEEAERATPEADGGLSPDAGAADASVAPTTEVFAPPPPVETSTDAGLASADAGALPVVVQPPPPEKPAGKVLAGKVAQALHDSLASLEGSNHARNLAADAAWRARARLEGVPALMQQYQAISRGDAERDDAVELGHLVDRARARLLKAAGELDRAVTAPVDGFEGTMPFQAADDAIARARAEVVAVDAKVASTP